MFNKIRQKFITILHISVQPGDSDEARERKALSIAMSLGMALGGIIWGIYCLIGSEPGAAVIPFAYTVGTFFNILYLRTSGNDQRFRTIQIFLSLMLPFLLMVALGGFRGSGAVVIWSMVAPLGAALFTRRREAIIWFVAFILLVIFSGFIEPIIARLNNLSPLLITIFYVMNILAPTSLAIILLFYFLQQRHQALELLKDAQMKAEAANLAKSTFLANMSHELRSPMNAVLGFTQVMLRSPDLNHTQKENLKVIMRSGEHLLTLINQVLDLSKVEAGRMELVEQTFDLPGMLDELQEMFSLQASNKGLQLTFEHTPQVPHYIQSDELKLRQVLINLLNNALKFTQVGRVSVRVNAAVEEELNGRSEQTPVTRLYFEVEDSGPGIRPQEIEAVFAAFSQTEVGMNAGGAGLGMPISRQLVRLMGGDMHISSEVGQGSIFSFDLPAKVVTTVTGQHKEHQGQVVGLQPDQPNYRILIVDDEWENREALFQLLDPVGFKLRQAKNGEEALAIAADWRPHFIWMDIRMPVMDGYEASKAIKAAQLMPDPVVVALTASTFVDESEKAYESGCAGIVYKPYHETEIFDTLAHHLGVRYRYQDTSSLEETEQGSLVTSSMLAALSPALRAQLIDALIQLDTGRMDELVAEIKTENEALAGSIADMLHRFEYESLLETLEELDD